MRVEKRDRVSEFVERQSALRAAWTTPPKPPHTLRVVTWNLHEQGGPHGNDYAATDCWRVLHRLAPDVVCLQEVVTPLELLPYSTVPTHGVVLACSTPLTDAKTVQLTTDRVVVTASTLLPSGALLRIGATHIEPYDKVEQRRQFLALPRNIHLLAGDFNTPLAPAYIPWLRADANRAATCWFGTRIDMVFHDHHVLTPLHCFAVPSALSDHIPVVADYTCNAVR